MAQQDALGFLSASRQLGSRLGLERVSELCARLGNPQDRVPAVHVAGTNGKGSTSAMIASILTSAGYKTGLYTSPYIEDISECIRIDGEPITQEELAAVAELVRGPADDMARQGDPPTSFELETAIAFQWFAQSGCRAAVIETGLGGRLDATNILAHPALAVLTSISYDHMHILGNTLGSIASEKCGILKPGGVAVCAPQQYSEAMETICQKAHELDNELILPDRSALSVGAAGLNGTDIVYHGRALHIAMIGRHQVDNAIAAVEAALALRERRGFALPDEAIARGIAHAVVPLRQEIVSRRPILLLDGAHNPDGLQALAATMGEHLAGQRMAVVMGMLADKDHERSIAAIAPLCGRFIACRPQSDRALAPEALAAVARLHCKDVAVQEDCAEALAGAIRYAGAEGTVVVCGSLYLAGPIRKAYYNNPGYFQQLM